MSREKTEETVSAERVLIVDDSRQTRAYLKEALRELFSEFLEAGDGIEAIKVFMEKRPGFIITDVEMPSINGYRLISTIRGMEGGRDIPIIMLTAKHRTLEKKLMGYDLGASDFIVKPVEDGELVARVRSLLKMKRLQDELKRKNELLKELAVTDELTGLYNRRHFFEAVREQLALGLRHGFKVACLLIDIDNFKKVNDTYGHMAGDEVLRTIGRLLRNNKREGELLARFGGEEFVICLFNTDSDSARLAADRFSDLIRSHDFSPIVNAPLRITASIGLSIFPQDPRLSADELLRAADTALYTAKGSGKNTVSVKDLSLQID